MKRKTMDRIKRDADLRFVRGVGDFCGRDFSKKFKEDDSFVGHWLGRIYAIDLPNAPRIQREVIASLKPALEGRPGGLADLVDKVNRIAPQRGTLVVEPRVGHPDGKQEVVRRHITKGNRRFRKFIFFVVGSLLEGEVLFRWLGVCKNKECEKIFIRSRAGRAQVCSAPCGVKYQNQARLERGYFNDLRKFKRQLDAKNKITRRTRVRR